ncbi:hypothetical protein SKAU_G00164390 [Synaphobranchus kaupii]|uniref:chitin synthase n=1 Tax=Synaphobranchus kaupii TaxID=118154 RepID=A0A9Q1FJ50_SYNKA|nr:hypothetical protein SKAU_G00164390 [Synaphobranchus kaupii]
MEELKYRGKKREGRHRDTWDPFQLNPIGAEKEEQRRCFSLAQHLVALIVGVFVLVTAVISKMCLIEALVALGTSILVLIVMPQFDVLTNLFSTGGVCFLSAFLQASNKIQELLTELDGFRDFVVLISSLLKIAVIGAVYAIHAHFIERCDWSYFSNVPSEALKMGIEIFFLQAFSSAICHWFGVVACKIHAVRFSFALPLSCTGPTVLILGMVLFLTQASQVGDSSAGTFITFCSSLRNSQNKNTTQFIIAEISRSICRTTLNSYYESWPFSLLALEGLCMWLGLLTATCYVWKIKVHRIERTSQLFVRRLYESAFIDQSMLLNTKMKVARARNQESNDEIENCVIYLCATMWHETYDEMLKILTSMFRLDRYRGDPKEEHKDKFEFECHIFVDDAFQTEKETEKRLVNEYVNDLIHVVIEVYRVFTNKEPDDVSIIETPFGGRLMFVMPEGNMLYVHLKDKQLIRNKKRWSQIMYLYYLLGWKGYNVKNPQKITRQNNPCRASLISLDGESFLLPTHDNDTKRRNISDDNTYIMALDGDTDFHPAAVILLVDRLRMYDNVGAACGRIHPTGMGPMVWYQKFEYAVGHWLQKTAEHVFGSVLCSPGCFSLFRGSALMDDNVLKRYTTTSTRASEYVQYDQGEDRWLCTLLLQQGWRVEYNAASDAYTNAPQEFKEFYNQRRRWGPSTLANTLDLLHSGKETSKKNSSISMLYIFYQIFTVGSSILGPASVSLMVAGAFQFVFKMEGTLAIIISVIPPVVYMVICFTCKPNLQITIAGILSVMYAFLMTASLFSIIGDMVIQGTFITPTGLFLVSMTILYMVTAILHPQEFGMIIYGLMYFICIPSGYLLLTIYSLVNMHNVSWGTRESSQEKEEGKSIGLLCDRNCKLCCWDIKCQVTQETKNAALLQIQNTINPNATAPRVNVMPQQIQDTQGNLSSIHPEQQAAESTTHSVQHLSSFKSKETKAKELPRDSDFGSEGSKSENLSDVKDDDDYDSIDEDDNFEEYKSEVVSESDWVNPVKTEFLKKLTYANMKRNLQEQIRYSLRNKNQEETCEELVMMLTDTMNIELKDQVGPEDVLTDSQLEGLQYALNEVARRILKTNRMERLERRVKRAIEKTLIAPQVEKLNEDENDFWVKLLERYLKPIVDEKAHKDEVTRELKSLRNKATFLYFILNVLWVVATFFLQAIGDTISITFPKYYPDGRKTNETMKVEPLSLMFLLSFAVLLIIQFLAMLYHRIYTLIHVVSYRSTEKDYKVNEEEDEDDEGLTLENHIASGLVITSDDL